MHRQSPLDWISRALMLALSAMVTLSVIGVIAAIPRGAMEDRIGIDRPRQQQRVPERPQPEPTPSEVQVRRHQPVEGTPQQSPPAIGGTSGYGSPALAAPAPEQLEAERWLEAITYALMALVGLAALATLILWRSLKERRRIADALEALSSVQREGRL